MKTFIVPVTMRDTKTVPFTVSCETLEEASELAVEKAREYDWSWGQDADFEADDENISEIQNMSKRNLCVDGHEFEDPESCWMGDGEFPPFVIFDSDEQTNLLGDYQTRAAAEEAMSKLQ